MPLIDTYRTNLQRKRAEYANLSQKKAQISSRIAAEQAKKIAVNNAISHTKSLPTIKSKSAELVRIEKTIADLNKTMSDLDHKMVQKEKEIMAEEKHIRTEEEKIDKKRRDEEKKRDQTINNNMQSISRTLNNHSAIQERLYNEIEQLKYIPPSITVLFLASNPKSIEQLWLDEEARSIQEMIRKSDYRDSVKFETRWAVRPFDVLQAINETNPTIVHFSGHGTDRGDLVLQGASGDIKYVSIDAISQTMATSSDTIKLVFFNACYSKEQAKSIVNYIDAAIGMSNSIGDEAARVFAAQFYSAIGFGLTLDRAFNQAKAALLLEGIPEENVPLLFTNDQIDSSRYYLVKP